MTALEDLKQLDESLYERFVSTRSNPQGPEAVAAGMRKLWEDTFRGLHNMLAFARTLAQPPTAVAMTRAASAPARTVPIIVLPPHEKGGRREADRPFAGFQSTTDQ